MRVLRSWGTRRSMRVLLKCPRMAETAKVMPAKLVKVSPTKTRHGYLFKKEETDGK